MEWHQLLLRFALGGTMVVAVTLVASASRNSVLAGIVASFPTVLLAGAISLRLSGFDSAFISRYFLGTIAGISIVMVFSLGASYLVRHWGFAAGLAGALTMWLAIASVVAFRLVARH